MRPHFDTSWTFDDYDVEEFDRDRVWVPHPFAVTFRRTDLRRYDLRNQIAQAARWPGRLETAPGRYLLDSIANQLNERATTRTLPNNEASANDVVAHALWPVPDNELNDLVEDLALVDMRVKCNYLEVHDEARRIIARSLQGKVLRLSRRLAKSTAAG